MGGGLFCIDVDTYKGDAPKQYLQELKGLKNWSDTQKHVTARGGEHYIFKGSLDTFAPSAGVEVRGERSYIILPPSQGYKIVNNVGFSPARRDLISKLEATRPSIQLSGIATIEASVLSAAGFHENLTMLAAHKAAQHVSQADILSYLTGLLNSSVASNPAHDRHDRWKKLILNNGEELTRMVTTATAKYNDDVTIEATRELVLPKIDTLRSDAESIFGKFTVHNEEKDPAPKLVTYDGTDPFANDGYMVHEEIKIESEKSVLYPLFTENEMVVLAAEPKAGKTAIALNLCFGIASGKDIGNTLTVPERRGVLYFSLEGNSAVRKRIEAEKRRRKLDEEIPFRVVERAHRLVDDKVQDELVSKIVAADQYYREHYGCSIGMIVIDTLTKAMPGSDQNSVEDTSQLFQLVSKLRMHRVVACVMFVHHKSKAGQVRGSTNIEAEPDTVLTVSKDEVTEVATLSVKMARNIDDHLEFGFQLSGYDLGFNQQGKPINAVVVDLLESAVPNTDGTYDDISRGRLLAELTSLGVGEFKPIDYFQDAAKNKRRNHAANLVKRVKSEFAKHISIPYGNFVVTVDKRSRTIAKIVVREISPLGDDYLADAGLSAGVLDPDSRSVQS